MVFIHDAFNSHVNLTLFFSLVFSLCGCSITEKLCVSLTSALNLNPSHLRELDLSMNKLGDAGVENLGLLLSSSQCKLKKLQLVSSLLCAAITV